jgi:hypothetical protein
MRASGHYGEVRHGYFVAATVKTWELEWLPRPPSATRFTVTAFLDDIDTFRVAQRPLSLALAVGDGEWIWHDVHPDVDGDNVTFTLTARPSPRLVPRTPEDRDGIEAVSIR